MRLQLGVQNASPVAKWALQQMATRLLPEFVACPAQNPTSLLVSAAPP